MKRSKFYNLSIFKLFGAFLVMTAHYMNDFLEIHFYAFGTGIFFIISGYYAFKYEKNKNWKYLKKRFFRLFPGFFVAVLLYLSFKYNAVDNVFLTLFNHATFFLFVDEKIEVFILNPAFWSMPVFLTFFIVFAFMPTSFLISKSLIFILTCISLIVPLLMTDTFFSVYLNLWVFPYYLYAFFIGGWIGQNELVFDYISQKIFLSIFFITIISIILSGVYYKEFYEYLFNNNVPYHQIIIFLESLLLWSFLNLEFQETYSKLVLFLGNLSFGIYLFHNLPTLFIRQYMDGYFAILISVFLTLIIAFVVRFLLNSFSYFISYIFNKS